MKRAILPRQRPYRQRGVFAILYAMVLPVMLGMIGLAIDLAMVYARGHELQSVADSAALAAARALDGTPAGLAAAMASANNTAQWSQYRFLNAGQVVWNPAALSFGASASGPWIAATAATAADAPTLTFAKVDTSGLDAVYGKVLVVFLQVVGIPGDQQLMRRAVAGRKDSEIAPLGVCALSNTEIGLRSNAPAVGVDEAVEYGFRRGVTYDLLNLNPNGLTPRNFVVNPLDFAPAPAIAAHQSDDAVRPFVCTGTMPAPPIGTGTMLYVREPFPASMVAELNSRFGTYTGGSVCTKFGAPPDLTQLDMRGGYPLFWMAGVAAPVRASAEPLAAAGKLVTVADASPVPSGTTSASYGTLWSFGKPLRYNSGALGAPFTKNQWSQLYPVTSGSPLSTSYTDPVAPYERGAPYRILPTPLAGVLHRRILNVPLLECPVNGASARLLGIGRFMMTTPASTAPAGVYAEFGGLTTYGQLAASAVLYQ